MRCSRGDFRLRTFMLFIHLYWITYIFLPESYCAPWVSQLIQRTFGDKWNKFREQPRKKWAVHYQVYYTPNTQRMQRTSDRIKTNFPILTGSRTPHTHKWMTQFRFDNNEVKNLWWEWNKLKWAWFICFYVNTYDVLTFHSNESFSVGSIKRGHFDLYRMDFNECSWFL